MKLITPIASRILASAVLVLLAAGAAAAAGTPANTNIANQASAAYTMSGAPMTSLSNISSIRVAEVIGCTVTWQDTAPGVQVTPGAADRVTTFRLTNTGNGTDTYGLAGLSAGVAGDQFDPVLGAIYLDTNGNSAYDAGTDALYVAGTNDPTLARDAQLTLFVMNTIPGAGVVDNDLGNTRLTATSKTGTGAPGTVIAGAGDGGTDAVIGSTGGSAGVIGTYVVSSIVVVGAKSVTVLDQFGGSLAIPGATLRYVITVTVSGTGTANSIVIRDGLPPNTAYLAGTLRLNGTGLTDGADADAGDVNNSAANTVTVNLGNLTAASPVQSIQFDVKIN